MPSSSASRSSSFRLDVLGGTLHAFRAGDVVRRREDTNRVDLANDVTSQWMEVVQCLDLVTEEFDADRQLFVRRNDLDRVAAHAERTSRERHVVAVVLNVDEQTQERIPRYLHTDVQLNRAIEVRLRCTQAVDARHRGHHDHVPA